MRNGGEGEADDKVRDGGEGKGLTNRSIGLSWVRFTWLRGREPKEWLKQVRF